MDFTIRHSRLSNIFLGLFTIGLILPLDFIAIDKGKIDYIIFTLIATLIFGAFAYDRIQTGLRHKCLIKFNEIGILSFGPEFELLWKEVEGYNIQIGKFSSYITFLIDNGKCCIKSDISFGDKSEKEIDKYLISKLKKI
jgi:hypothetical protein